MKILVTGGSGFLGSHVADELTKYGHKVTIYDLLKSKWIKKNQKFIKGNITVLYKGRGSGENEGDLLIIDNKLQTVGNIFNRSQEAKINAEIQEILTGK